MSTTRFWGEPDNGDKVRRAKEDPSRKWEEIFWGEIGGNGWSEGSKCRKTLKTAICKPSDGVKGNDYHTVLG